VSVPRSWLYVPGHRPDRVRKALASAAGGRAIVAHCRLGRARVAQRLTDNGQAAELGRQAADLFERLGDLDRAYEARSLSS